MCFLGYCYANDMNEQNFDTYYTTHQLTRAKALDFDIYAIKFNWVFICSLMRSYIR